MKDCWTWVRRIHSAPTLAVGSWQAHTLFVNDAAVTRAHGWHTFLWQMRENCPACEANTAALDLLCLSRWELGAHSCYGHMSDTPPTAVVSDRTKWSALILPARLKDGSVRGASSLIAKCNPRFINYSNPRLSPILSHRNVPHSADAAEMGRMQIWCRTLLTKIQGFEQIKPRSASGSKTLLLLLHARYASASPACAYIPGQSLLLRAGRPALRARQRLGSGTRHAAPEPCRRERGARWERARDCAHRCPLPRSGGAGAAPAARKHRPRRHPAPLRLSPSAPCCPRLSCGRGEVWAASAAVCREALPRGAAGGRAAPCSRGSRRRAAPGPSSSCCCCRPCCSSPLSSWRGDATTGGRLPSGC